MRRPSPPDSIPLLIWTFLLIVPAGIGLVLIPFFFGSEGAPGRTWPDVYPVLWLGGVLLACASSCVRHRRTTLALATIVLIGAPAYGLAFQTFN